MATHRFNPHQKNSSRGGSAQAPGSRMSLKQRGGMGSETAPPGAGSSGFRAALHSSGHGSGNQPLKSKIRKVPSRFAQGGRTHGMHLSGQGNPTITAAKTQK